METPGQLSAIFNTQAFSSEGEGFAIRGTGVPVAPGQRVNVHLSEEQAFDLGSRIVDEYALRTGRAPLRLVIRKTSHFDAAETAGFNTALADISIVTLATMVPSAFRLVRFGLYPPKVGTGLQREWCAHLPIHLWPYSRDRNLPWPARAQPFEIKAMGPEDPIVAATDIFNLTRMNWNTADVRGKWPVTLSFARRVGGIFNEYGEQDPEEKSFRYFV